MLVLMFGGSKNGELRQFDGPRTVIEVVTPSYDNGPWLDVYNDGQKPDDVVSLTKECYWVVRFIDVWWNEHLVGIHQTMTTKDVIIVMGFMENIQRIIQWVIWNWRP